MPFPTLFRQLPNGYHSLSQLANQTSHQDHPKPKHEAFTACLDCNKKWASETAEKEPDFFPTTAKGQSPNTLWIGCSDSRVPETTILGEKPGGVFVHRNIANVVSPTDMSLLSAVEFSVR
jgi:carbonic anhydrase